MLPGHQGRRTGNRLLEDYHRGLDGRAYPRIWRPATPAVVSSTCAMAIRISATRFSCPTARRCSPCGARRTPDPSADPRPRPIVGRGGGDSSLVVLAARPPRSPVPATHEARTTVTRGTRWLDRPGLKNAQVARSVVGHALGQGCGETVIVSWDRVGSGQEGSARQSAQGAPEAPWRPSIIAIAWSRACWTCSWVLSSMIPRPRLCRHSSSSFHV